VSALKELIEAQAPDSDNAVAKFSIRVEELEAKRLLPRTLMGGSAAMREAGKLYMPIHEEESKRTYEARLHGTTLYNGFEETVKAQVGKMFEENVALNDDVTNATIKLLLDDIDGQGRALSPFFMESARLSMVDGVSYVFVDFPQLASSATLADQRAAKARPYWVQVPAANVLGWKSESINGSHTLTQVRIREEVTLPEGRFGERLVQRVRVLERGSFTVFEKVIEADGKVSWILKPELSGFTSWPDITVVPFYTNRTGFYEGEPPLRTLAEMNQEHWNSSSEQRHALSFARFAMLCVMGFEDDQKVVVGPNKTIKAPIGGDAKYVEPSGAGIEAGRLDLEAIERRMAVAGMELRVENAGSTTATAAAIDSAETNAGLRAVAQSHSDSLNLALYFTGMMLGVPEPGTLEVYDDFADPASELALGILTKVRGSGDLSRTALLQALVHHKILPDTFDADADAALLEQETQQTQGEAIDLLEAQTEINATSRDVEQ